MNGEVCCILQVCCPPAQQLKALAKWMMRAWNIAADTAAGYAGDLLAQVDLAPKGTVPAALAIGDMGPWMVNLWAIEGDVAARWASDLRAQVDLAPKDSVTPMIRAAVEIYKRRQEH